MCLQTRSSQDFESLFTDSRLSMLQNVLHAKNKLTNIYEDKKLHSKCQLIFIYTFEDENAAALQYFTTSRCISSKCYTSIIIIKEKIENSEQILPENDIFKDVIFLVVLRCDTQVWCRLIGIYM